AHGQWRIEAEGKTFCACAVVNAAGPAVLQLLGLARESAGHGMRLVRGSHIVVRKLFDHPFAYFFQLPDGRIFFAIPYEHDFTLIGTTDVDHQGGLDHIEASAEEIEYLCEGASRFFRQPVTPADVVWTYSGVRPLIDDGSGRPEAATRGYTLELSDESEGAPLLSVFGGKITTYRHLAQEAVNQLMPRLPELAGRDWTDLNPLPGGDFPAGNAAGKVAELAARYRFLEPDWADRLLHAYGTRAWGMLGDAKSLEDCGTDFGHGLTQREVDFLVAQEWAMTAEDILWRRSKLGLRFTTQEAARLSDYLKKKAST
ncbi:MAG TPA: glycerol-3-phosphate dehydrogenase, partial [Erythrobacter sp.]|nr:glycerol-3-phosphate dehydrogenase [Erythrobacter sp.]